MEQDVEPKQRSYGRDWGHDDRCEAAPQEPAHEERRKSHGDKRARGRSKRPDQQIYVPRARRGPHQVDSESVDRSERKPGIPLEQDDAPETEQRSRTRPGRGRARASVERYVPKARRTANEVEKNQDEDTQEAVNSGQFENHKTPDKSRRKSSEKSHDKSNDKASDRSSDKPSDSRSHSKKTKSKRSRSSSEKEGKQVSEMCLKKSPTSMKTEDIKDHTSHDSVIQGSGDQQFSGDSLSALSNTTQDYSNALNDNVPCPAEVANIAENEIDDSKSDVKGSDLMEFESTEKTADILEAKDIEAIDSNAVDSCEVSEELIACHKGGGDSSYLQSMSESEVVSNVDLDREKELEESISESKELETKDSIIDEDTQLSNEDLKESSNVPSAVIKRENSFVENLELDNTLHVSYSENCHYDMELEKGDETRQTTDTCDTEPCETDDSNDCSPSSIDILESENVNMPIDSCDQSAFNPAKRRKSHDADLETELMVDNSCSQDKTECQPTDSQVIHDNKDSRVSELEPQSAVASCVNETEKSNNSPVDNADIIIGTPLSSDSQDSEQNISSINSETPVPNFLKMSDSHAMPSNVPESELDKSGLDNVHNQIHVAKDIAKATEDNGVVMETAEDSWDAMFDDDGEALDPHIMDELTQKVGKVKVQKTQFDYLEFQPADPELDDEGYAHLVEIYDFPSDLITRDLLAAFRSFQDKGFDLKWVDDTHCIGIFSSKIAAQTALEISNPLIKVRPIASASRQTKLKAKKYASSLEPYKPRPVTTAAVARNLVTNALGLTSRVPRAKRDEERRKLKEAREKKKEAKQLENDVWDGKVGRCAMDEV